MRIISRRDWEPILVQKIDLSGIGRCEVFSNGDVVVPNDAFPMTEEKIVQIIRACTEVVDRRTS